jgi:hypothetical protein
LDGSNLEHLVTGLGNYDPFALAVDLVGGKIYFTRGSFGGPIKIQRANLDGSNVDDVIILTAPPLGLAVDVPAGKIYWGTGGGGGADKIQRANLDIPAGQTASTRTDVEDVVVAPEGVTGIALGYPRTVSAPTKRTPVVTWGNPADIFYGTALTAAQLNATASVDASPIVGTFTYTPVEGTVLTAGNGQTLHVDFVPTDTVNYANVSKDVSINVLQATTNTGLTSSLNSSTFGTPVTFTATVTSGVPGTLTGTVTFFDGALSIGTAAPNGAGQAVLSISTLSVATHNITAVYSGDGNFAGSTSAVLNQTVNKAPSTTVIGSPFPNPSEFNQNVTFTATVTGVGGMPTGTVTFKEGTVVLGTAPLNASGQAAFTISTLSIGNHNVKAFYNGDASYTISNSAQVKQAVNPVATTTSLTSSVNPSAIGQAVTFTAQVKVTSTNVAVTTGSVTFKDGNKSLGSVPLNASGQATFSASFSKKGSYKITAIYGGAATLATSTSNQVNQVVQP